MRSHVLVPLLGLLLTTSPEAQPASTPVVRFAAGSNAFGADLYRLLATAPGNVVVSPASLATALTMTWGGARGATGEEMKAVLHLDGSPAETMQVSGRLSAALTDPKRPVTVRIANRLFGEQTARLERAYLETTTAAYGAPLEALDFKGAPEAARERINAWVEGQTERRIRDLVPPAGVNGRTRLALVNAIYFVGDWGSPFAKEGTREAPFHTSPTERKSVPTMHRTGRLGFVAKDGLKVLELPYRGGVMSMLLVLPDRVDGLPELERSLTGPMLDGWARALTPQPVDVALPKFEVAPVESLSLGDGLRALGMIRAFDPDQADFTGIARSAHPADRLYLSRVFHKAFVRVDEKGTEAAAASAVIAGETTARRVEPPKAVEFRADHPFLFCIRDTASGLVLFLGRVADPSAR